MLLGVEFQKEGTLLNSTDGKQPKSYLVSGKVRSRVESSSLLLSLAKLNKHK